MEGSRIRRASRCSAILSGSLTRAAHLRSRRAATSAPRLRVEQRGPVDNHIHRGRTAARLRCRHVHEKALAITRYGVREAMAKTERPGDSRLEQSHGPAGLEALAGVDRDSHELALRTEIEQLFSLGTPARVDATRHGYLPFIAVRRPGLNVNLRTARFVGAVREESAVG